jgi:hypothetical protein
VLVVGGVCSLVLAAVWLIGHAPLDAVLVTVFQLDTAAAGTSQRIAVFFRHAREGAIEQDRDPRRRMGSRRVGSRGGPM